MGSEWSFESHCQSLVRRWEEGRLDASDAMREIRTTLAEEAEIREAEARKAVQS